jgi:hypothetical protein
MRDKWKRRPREKGAAGDSTPAAPFSCLFFHLSPVFFYFYAKFQGKYSKKIVII